VATRRESWALRFYERLTLLRALRLIILVALVLVLVAAALERVVEPNVFSSYGKACWWAIVTVTTVGYGDVVPESPGGRVVAAFLMLTGLSLIPTLTSVTVSILITKRSREEAARDERSRAETVAALARIEQQLERLESSLDS